MKKPRTKIREMAGWPYRELYTPSVLNFEWCCDCSLRHIVEYSLVRKRGKTYIGRRVERDQWATEARRIFNKRGVPK